MCLIAFRWQPQSARPLVLAANRDEFHQRPTQALHWWRWPQGPLAGRDGKAGGTWLAADRRGRYAVITNYRDTVEAPAPRSRGELPLAWLDCAATPARFATDVYHRCGQYGPFNLLLGTPSELWIVGTHAEPAAVRPGVHALSNHLLDTPWPKSIRAVERLEQWTERRENGVCDDIDGLLDLLDDRQPAAVGQLPETGVAPEFERLLSAPFVVSPEYGTRSSSALIIEKRLVMAERTFDPDGHGSGERVFSGLLGG
ncbi:MAG: NRDE family protein [Xanthomonadaceae bacterium]|nr:NRDE family protein [Xanthomonadaceae bacterium]